MTELRIPSLISSLRNCFQTSFSSSSYVVIIEPSRRPAMISTTRESIVCWICCGIALRSLSILPKAPSPTVSRYAPMVATCCVSFARRSPRFRTPKRSLSQFFSLLEPKLLYFAMSAFSSRTVDSQLARISLRSARSLCRSTDLGVSASPSIRFNKMSNPSRELVMSEYSPHARFQPLYALVAILISAIMSLGEKPKDIAWFAGSYR